MGSRSSSWANRPGPVRTDIRVEPNLAAYQKLLAGTRLGPSVFEPLRTADLGGVRSESGLGIDDTDSPKGGCTTWLLTELLREARREGIDLIGEPRLVRLNPNIPWKTRGNAALAARFGRGAGRRTKVAEIEGRPVFWYRPGRRPRPTEEGVVPRRRVGVRAAELVGRTGHRPGPGRDFASAPDVPLLERRARGSSAR